MHRSRTSLLVQRRKLSISNPQTEVMIEIDPHPPCPTKRIVKNVYRWLQMGVYLLVTASLRYPVQVAFSRYQQRLEESTVSRWLSELFAAMFVSGFLAFIMLTLLSNLISVQAKAGMEQALRANAWSYRVSLIASVNFAYVAFVMTNPEPKWIAFLHFFIGYLVIAISNIFQRPVQSDRFTNGRLCRFLPVAFGKSQIRNRFRFPIIGVLLLLSFSATSNILFRIKANLTTQMEFACLDIAWCCGMTSFEPLTTLLKSVATTIWLLLGTCLLLRWMPLPFFVLANTTYRIQSGERQFFVQQFLSLMLLALTLMATVYSCPLRQSAARCSLLVLVLLLTTTNIHELESNLCRMRQGH